MTDEASESVGGEIVEYVRSYGMHSLAYSCLQPRMQYHIESGIGFVAFQIYAGISIVLGDPVCAPHRRRHLLGNFVAMRRDACFVQVTSETAYVLRDMGWWITPYGVEFEIDVPAFSLNGKSKQDLRHYLNKTQGTVTILDVPDTEQQRDLLQTISDTWLQEKVPNQREMAFLVRPFCRKPEPQVRLFLGIEEGKPTAFVVFDPLFKEGQCVGYSASILRALPTASEGTLDSIVLTALDVFREEGRERFSLGCAPLFRLTDIASQHGKGSPVLFPVLCLLSKQGERLFNFRALAFHKTRYRAREVPVFVATRRLLPVRGIVACMRLSGIL